MKIIFVIFALAMSAFTANLTEQITKLTNLTANNKEATINLGNLKIGQSGIVINNDLQGKQVILCYATVISSDNNNSIIKFDFREIIEQSAIPKTKLLPKNGDTFIINHLYKNSMIIAPNFKAITKIKQLYSNFNFLDIDLFGAYLKINNTPAPKKEDIVTFAHLNDLGSIFLVENKNLHILDAISLTKIETIPFEIDDNTTISPFQTNVED
ncbi:MAG: plasminogen-binding N-terminal domain-containing protein, partial [Arcobacter sp.]|nr:plasminogen-binding N-terminal domain-containing protein [Arcobacter sp.]